MAIKTKFLLTAAFLALILFQFCISITAAPYQELPPRKGHVPVYIRHGDEALEEIHDGLAEAFKESRSQLLQSENLVSEPASTELPKVTTESDIASFDVIKSA